MPAKLSVFKKKNTKPNYSSGNQSMSSTLEFIEMLDTIFKSEF